MGIDPFTLQPAEAATWELNLLEAAGARSELQAVFEAARRKDRAAAANLASLARTVDEKSTWRMVLSKRLADSVRRGQGVILDYDVQRALRGSAKRIWVQLESYSGWLTHRLARPDRDDDLEATVRALADTHGAVTVEPAENEAAIEVQTAVLDLTSDVYEVFGLTHANRKRDLEAACKSILATDSTTSSQKSETCPEANAGSSSTSPAPPERSANSACASRFAFEPSRRRKSPRTPLNDEAPPLLGRRFNSDKCLTAPLMLSLGRANPCCRHVNPRPRGAHRRGRARTTGKPTPSVRAGAALPRDRREPALTQRRCHRSRPSKP